MNVKETKDFVRNAAHYTSPEIEMYETRKDIARLQTENRFHAAMLAAAMYLLVFRTKVLAAISGLRKIYDSSSTGRR